ncbi:hypothetical protein HQN87_12045 [Paenibacillus tritici]|jgi:hypothetical protein|uniref:Yip1 domain-containing protein n=1 Tax=Paenibacillus tritici TaxID=1873425 RepID=A0ABX2DR50_9BACL|nr:hypothetical protein [Paenibacillus tritici]NQX46064.1 hypothetical protein [Paenibacillus tritici]QUL52726.1 hypothetical protein KDC22_20050 [Paenibacillus tritici]
MKKYEGIGSSTIKYAILNFILVITNLFLYASGPDGGGTGDREEGFYFYQMYLVCLVVVFVVYGLWSVTLGRHKKNIKGLTAIPVLSSSVCIAGLLIYATSKNKSLYDGIWLNDSGSEVLALYADTLIYLVYFFLLFAISISVLGIISRNKWAILGLLLNLTVSILHILVFKEWVS